MIRLLLFVTFGAAAAYAATLLILWRFQERVVFQPPARVAASRVPAHQVRYRTEDGVELFAYVVGECSPSGTVLLAFHGNADLSRWFVPWAIEVARETGACVVLPEYRGYDSLPGQPTYLSSAKDARAALDYVHDSLHVPQSNIVYFGHSLGTAVAAELADVAAPRALILQSPFSSARDMGRRMFLPGLVAFWGLVSRVHFNTIARVESSNVPVWVVHGDNDFVVPVRMGREVFNAAKTKGDLLIVHGAGHNDVPEVGGRDYWNWFARAMGVAPSSATPAARAGTRSEP
ncbi:MAG TPA: alpha/beta hydrolase [Gemmatimonadaceae bacterium]